MLPLGLPSARVRLQAATLGLMAFLLGGVARGCSPPIGDYTEPTLIDMVGMSSLVFYGMPLAHYRTEHLGNDAYTAKMNIFCILKGSKMPFVFNVTGAGYIPGMCFSNNLDVGNHYLVFMSETGGSWRIDHSEDASTDKLCNITHNQQTEPVYPDKPANSKMVTECPTLSRCNANRPPPQSPPADKPPADKPPANKPQGGQKDTAASVIGEGGNGVETLHAVSVIYTASLIYSLCLIFL